ncbi:uncharacterized protein LOC119173760 isoform X1 [Rhipicephalus microplus]|uniref:uncharacterized protein LOC119173760 isoform X1 n=1 Tax=Rhipicephalus microplus TaxID=6941 RepID=UPI003F6D31A1
MLYKTDINPRFLNACVPLTARVRSQAHLFPLRNNSTSVSLLVPWIAGPPFCRTFRSTSGRCACAAPCDQPHLSLPVINCTPGPPASTAISHVGITDTRSRPERMPTRGLQLRVSSWPQECVG